MNENITKAINCNRETSSRYHTSIAREWRLYGESQKLHVPLAYSAFEFRMSIERLLFEFYYMIKRRKGFNDKDAKKASSLKNLIIAISKEAGNREILLKRLKFNRILAENQQIKGVYLSGKYLPSVFDIQILDKYWQKLSNYCHKQLKPHASWESMGNLWVENGYKLLNEVENYLYDISYKNSIGWFPEEDLQIELKEMLIDYIEGKIDEKSLRGRIIIATPVFELRKRTKK